jgi:hypothetical protein
MKATRSAQLTRSLLPTAATWQQEMNKEKGKNMWVQ